LGVPAPFHFLPSGAYLRHFALHLLCEIERLITRQRRLHAERHFFQNPPHFENLLENGTHLDRCPIQKQLEHEQRFGMPEPNSIRVRARPYPKRGSMRHDMATRPSAVRGRRRFGRHSKMRRSCGTNARTAGDVAACIARTWLTRCARGSRIRGISIRHSRRRSVSRGGLRCSGRSALSVTKRRPKRTRRTNRESHTVGPRGPTSLAAATARRGNKAAPRRADDLSRSPTTDVALTRTWKSASGQGQELRMRCFNPTS
jgi:hypothetical protein